VGDIVINGKIYTQPIPWFINEEQGMYQLIKEAHGSM
jgi:hypothetical protein